MGRASALKVTEAQVSADSLSVRLKIPGLRPGFVTQLRASGLRSASQPLRHDTCFFTLNQVPNNFRGPLRDQPNN